MQYSNFFKEIIIQLLGEADGRDSDLLDEGKISCDNDMDLTLHFMGEIFARICRRGYVGLFAYHNHLSIRFVLNFLSLDIFVLF